MVLNRRQFVVRVHHSDPSTPAAMSVTMRPTTFCGSRNMTAKVSWVVPGVRLALA